MLIKKVYYFFKIIMNYSRLIKKLYTFSILIIKYN
jgi:hypothetical protein